MSCEFGSYLGWTPCTAALTDGHVQSAVLCLAQMCFHTDFLCSKNDQNLTRRLEFRLVSHGECSWRDLLRGNCFLSVLASSHPRRRQMEKLWWIPDCFAHLSPEGCYTHLASRALWKHISVGRECLRKHSGGS